MTLSVTGLAWLIHGAIGLAMVAPVVLIVLWFMDRKKDTLW